MSNAGHEAAKASIERSLQRLQSDVVVIPKSTHKERMTQNIDVFDFMLDEGKSLFFDHYDPATAEMLTQMGKTRKA